MRFKELNESLPYVFTGKEKSVPHVPYKNITLLFPGRHAADTKPLGGDFCVCVTDKNLKWNKHQFTHDDIFKDIGLKTESDPVSTQQLMIDYKALIAENAMMLEWVQSTIPGIEPGLFLKAVQCLAVAEHRRYKRFENKFGGRFLPFRFSAGIAEGLWTAQDAIDKQRRGRPGVEELEKIHGLPALTKELMK